VEQNDENLHNKNNKPECFWREKLGKNYHNSDEGSDEEKVEKVKRREHKARFAKALGNDQIGLRVLLKFSNVSNTFDNCNEKKRGHDNEQKCTDSNAYFVLYKVCKHPLIISLSFSYCVCDIEDFNSNCQKNFEKLFNKVSKCERVDNKW